MAAYALGSWWPSEFKFNHRLTASARQRERATFLAANGGAALPRASTLDGEPDRIVSVVFTSGSESAENSAKEGILKLQGAKVDSSTLNAALATFGACCPAGVALLQLERSSDGGGFRVVCDFIRGKKCREDGECWSTVQGVRFEGQLLLDQPAKVGVEATVARMAPR